MKSVLFGRKPALAATRSLPVFLVLILVSGTSLPVWASQNYLQNGSFENDISGWSFFANAGQAMVWDDTLGSPSPGSLRLEQNNGSVGTFAASECVEAPPGSAWILDALAREEAGSTNMSCVLGLLIYMQPDCADPSGGLVSGQQGAGNDWTALDVDFEMPAGYAGIRATLIMSANQPATGACNFDSVRLTGPPNFAEVPALGRHALAGLIAALALAGLFWLRRAY